VIHRDLKPENVLLVDEAEADTVKLLDFGIAKLRTTDEPTQRTQAGLVLGTPGYMAPEQILGKELDARCDIYALGILLYEMVTGAPAYAATSVGEMLVAQATKPPKRPSEVAKRAIPRELEQLIVACLATDPTKRPATAGDVAEALRHAAGLLA
jgi:serine/threonine-protein kinase